MALAANGEVELSTERLAFARPLLDLDGMPVRVLQFDLDRVLRVGRLRRDLHDDSDAQRDVEGSRKAGRDNGPIYAAPEDVQPIVLGLGMATQKCV
jgi:hypothetical protein